MHYSVGPEIVPLKLDPIGWSCSGGTERYLTATGAVSA